MLRVIWEFPKLGGYLRVPLKGSFKGSLFKRDL